MIRGPVMRQLRHVVHAVGRGQRGRLRVNHQHVGLRLRDPLLQRADLVGGAQFVLDGGEVKRYAHVFFDLDHTLWDFRANSRETLGELYRDLELEGRGVGSPAELIEEFEAINDVLWRKYEGGQIDKAVLRVLRFRDTLLRFGVRDDKLATRLGSEYLERCPQKKALHAGVPGLLAWLHGRVRMHVITNGFAEVQHVKLKSSGIEDRFAVVLTSEEAGAKKPDARIFMEAMRRAKATPEGSLMVGDNPYTDLAGARRVGMDQAHFTGDGAEPDVDATFHFAHFDRLRERLG